MRGRGIYEDRPGEPTRDDGAGETPRKPGLHRTGGEWERPLQRIATLGFPIGRSTPKGYRTVADAMIKDTPA